MGRWLARMMAAQDRWVRPFGDFYGQQAYEIRPADGGGYEVRRAAS